MARISPTDTRVQMLDTFDGLEVIIPGRRNLLVAGFLLLWLGGWAMGETFAIRQLLKGGLPGFADAFLVFWLGGWTLGGGFALYTVLSMVFGREHIILRPDALVIRRELFSIARSREYDLDQIRNLRVSPAAFNRPGSAASLQGFGTGGCLIAFDYGASTIRFGSAIEEAEAGQVVERLASRHRFAA